MSWNESELVVDAESVECEWMGCACNLPEQQAQFALENNGGGGTETLSPWKELKRNCI